MVLIKKDRRKSKINYDYWNELQRSLDSQRNAQAKEDEMAKKIEELLEE